MTHDEMIAVIQAAKEGKALQARHRTGNEWVHRDPADTLFQFGTYEYRVRPEPKVVWVNEYPNGPVPHDSKGEAIERAKPLAMRIAVKYVEVFDE